jgi:glycosyltransferase involved in cell wall biosynthesis
MGRYLKAINAKTSLCYPIAEDCADIARVIYEVPESKIKVQSLGTDTKLFKPCTTIEEAEQRVQTRIELDFLPEDIVSIYTGRITKDKGPSVLARAIALLHDRNETNYRGLFVGIGEEEEMKLIRGTKGCVIKDFVRAFELPRFYQACDVAVWPFQESTSQLDAIACGLPLIVNDTVTVRQRADGNGLFYKLGDAADLASKLLNLKNDAIRKEMGARGVEKARADFSWIKLAKERVIDYQQG